HNADRLLKLIETVYRWLPLGTLVNNKVLIVHGGISDSTDIETIKNIDRQKYVSLLRPPVIDGVVITTDHDKKEWKQVFDILWSDPQRGEGCIPNTLRGAGTYFGPDVTEKFLAKNNLQFLVRSHECKIDGYEIVHDNKVNDLDVICFPSSHFSGMVSVTDWCTALEKVTGLSVPWRMLRAKLASLDPSTGHVLYMTTFQDNLTKREVGLNYQKKNL
ncbi:unnamed protein product, partial [Nesidiocoris tenuis]